jgi:hypothetical protein
MSTVTVSRAVAGQSNPQVELQDELRHIRDLVFVRDLLRERGGTPTELRECDAVIGEARTRLAESAKRTSTHWSASESVAPVYSSSTTRSSSRRTIRNPSAVSRRTPPAA